MIKNEKEYKNAVKRVVEEKQRIKETKERLKLEGLKREEIERVIEPIISFHLQLEEEVKSYEQLKRGKFPEIINFRGVGHLLVCLRIAQGLTQSDLAKKLKVSSSQVSRDERNEYHGITFDRANKILEILGVEILSKVKVNNAA